MTTIKETTTSRTEALRLGVVKRVVAVVFGCIGVTILGGLLPLMYVIPVSREVTMGERPDRGALDMMPWGAIAAGVFWLAVVIALGYFSYDLIRTFMRYQKSRQDDQQMFP